jgi:EmrB/QacA subfamily drug resistance transporter
MQEQIKAQRAALIVATLSSFLGPFMGAAVNVALPAMSHEFAFGTVLSGWINTAFLLVAAAFQIPCGRLGDLYGRKRVFLLGVVVLTAASVLTAIAANGTQLIIDRALQGLGTAMILATGMPILVSVYPPGQRGKALGIAVAAVYLGLSVGPFIGGFITQHFGWRFIFWINLPFGILLASVVLLMLKGDWADAHGASFDLKGSALFILSLLAAMYGLSSLHSLLSVLLLVAGIVGLVVFVIYEQRIDYPVVEIALFRRNIVFAFSNLAALINYAATFAVGFLLSMYLQRIRGFTPQHTGIILLAQPVIQAAFSPLAGRLSDKMEPRIVSSAGMALTFAGLLLLMIGKMDASVPYLVFCLAVQGLGFALFSSPNTNAIMSSVERRHVGVAGAMVGTMRQIGMMISMGIVMMTLSLTTGDVELTPQHQALFVGSMRLAFGIFAALCFAGIFASLARGNLHRD